MINRLKYSYVSKMGKYFRLSKKPPMFTHGKDEFLFTSDKKSFLDFSCGSGTTILGHNNLSQKNNLKSKIDLGLLHTGPHFMSPIHLKYFHELKFFFNNNFNVFNITTNGTEATETAFKLAFHHTKKKKIIYFEGSYHGRTGYSMSSSDMKGVNKDYYHNKNFIKCKFNNIDDFKNKFNKYKKDLAAIIIEPIQATSGFNFSENKFLNQLRLIANKNSCLLIFDEVWTGFGKSGYNFAYEYYKVKPDIIILGKSVGGGMPLGLIAFNNILDHDYPGAQSSTFQGNIISIYNSYFFLKYIKKINYLKKISKIENFMISQRHILKSFKPVIDFRGIGNMWGIEINTNYSKKKDFTNLIRSQLLTKGLITWECGIDGNVIGLVPPICTSRKSLNLSIEILTKILSNL